MTDSGISQINIPAILIANGIGVCLMLSILLGKRRGLRVASYSGRFFYLMCILCLTLCILETFSFLLDGAMFPGAREIAVFASAATLMIAVSVSYLWVCFVDFKLFSDKSRFKNIYLYRAIPAAIIILMSAANLFFDVFFGISSDNIYYRTRLFLFPWLVVYGYMTYGALLSCRYRKRADRYIFMPTFLFLLPVYLGSLIQLLFYGIALIWVSLAMGLTLLYMNLQTEEAYLDPLTRLYNRNYLIHYMNLIVKQSKNRPQIVGIMLDVDNFKHINDSYGHTEGDLVLQAVGKILLRSARDMGAVVRYGGDEFILLLEDPQPGQLDELLKRIRTATEEYNASRQSRSLISISIGAAEFDYENVFGFFQDMDLAMYKEKKAFYLQWELEESQVTTEI